MVSNLRFIQTVDVRRRLLFIPLRIEERAADEGYGVEMQSLRNKGTDLAKDVAKLRAINKKDKPALNSSGTQS